MIRFLYKILTKRLTAVATEKLLVYAALESVVLIAWYSRTLSPVLMVFSAGVRCISGVPGAPRCTDGRTASKASSQDALHLLRCHCQSVRGNQPSCHRLSRLPVKNWSAISLFVCLFIDPTHSTCNSNSTTSELW